MMTNAVKAGLPVETSISDTLTDIDRATARQIQSIKNTCFNRSNLDYVYITLKRLRKDTLYQLSIGEAKDIIFALVGDSE